MSYELMDFQKDVIEKSHQQPVLVDFWADWCGPCKMLGPILEKLAAEQSDLWTLVKIDTTEHQELAQEFGIRGIPNCKLFIDGKVVNEFSGALPEAMLRDWLKKALPSKMQEKFNEALQLLGNGESEQGRGLLQEVLENDPQHHQASIVLAQTWLYEDEARALEIVKNIEMDSPYYDAAESLRHLANLFALSASPEKLGQSTQKDNYLAAIRALKSGDFDQALTLFVDIMIYDRKLDDDGARKACIAIFKMLGEEHELTRKHRPGFSSALFS